MAGGSACKGVVGEFLGSNGPIMYPNCDSDHTKPHIYTCDKISC